MKTVKKYTPRPEPTAEDWIILRVVREWVLHDRDARNRSLTATKSVDFLIQKLGLKTVTQMIDELWKEHNKC
jgi:hypothetical protein